jgi:hypothetical protein
MGRSLIGSSNNSSQSLINLAAIQARQSIQLNEHSIQLNEILKQFPIFQDKLKYLIKLGIGETPPDLLDLNEKKTELITIMNDYLTQKFTRVDTVNRLSALETKIA